MNKIQVLVIPLLLLIAGCTNMAGDVARTIHPAPSSALDEIRCFPLPVSSSSGRTMSVMPGMT
ncbi:MULTISPECIES: hypothetical protein [Marinobacter]|uniref:hypothetical protein n=1 Tax=Marinobacter TaxID=2742 RepID=UPI001D0DBB05|nr:MULTISPECIES: hypothetical protein [Marinobacter]